MRSLKPFLFILGTLLLGNACAPDELTPTINENAHHENASNAKEKDKRLNRNRLDELILEMAAKNKDQIDWRNATDEMIWSALLHSDGLLSVGYTIPGFDENNLDKVDLKAGEWKQVQQTLLKIVFEEEKGENKELQQPEDVIAWPGEGLPNFELKVTQLNTIRRLRATGFVRYMDVSSYLVKGTVGEKTFDDPNARFFNGPGCGSNEHADAPMVAMDDFWPTTPNNSKVSWQNMIHNAPVAWSRGVTGAGITVAYLDSGLSPEQQRMNSQFNQGAVTQRWVDRQVTYPNSLYPFDADETPDDECGHGTCCAAIGTAPRSNQGLSPVGIAYGANLVSVRASPDVLLYNTRRCRGVADAYTRMARRSDVRVISMSMGTPYVIVSGNIIRTILYVSNTIRDGIRLAHRNGKLMFCAAGTTPGDLIPKGFVIFPAVMSEVYAVTGLNMKFDAQGSRADIHAYVNDLNPCDECFHGQEVDFAVVIQKWSGSARRVLTLPRLNETEPTSFGGSSAATAAMAGMATAVWSRYPWMSRDRLVDHLRAHSMRGNARHSRFGWGMLNMDSATIQNLTQ
jgi:subtilisin family serine protease